MLPNPVPPPVPSLDALLSEMSVFKSIEVCAVTPGAYLGWCFLVVECGPIEAPPVVRVILTEQAHTEMIANGLVDYHSGALTLYGRRALENARRCARARDRVRSIRPKGRSRTE